MSADEKTGMSAKLKGPAKSFAEYCEAELERRRNAEADFDEAVYQQAMQLVLRKLGVEEIL